MKRSFTLLALFVALLASNVVVANNIWTYVGVSLGTSAPVINASKYLVYKADEVTLKAQLFSLPADPASGWEIALPMPDGRIKYFRAWQTSIMPAELAAKYPGIKTFTCVSLDDPLITAKLDFTLYGFHAMVYDGSNTSFIDPYDNSGSGYYMVRYKRDEIHQWNDHGVCATKHHEQVIKDKAIDIVPPIKAQRTVNGYQLRTYRLALACSHQYAQAATSISSPLVSQVFSKMVTSINRVNGVYEREVSLTMIFAAKEDTLISTIATGGPNGNDPFSLINDSDFQCISMNQVVCDARLGVANFDIGHVFTTGAGGLSDIEVVCQDGFKAMSVTGQPAPVGDGFDIDYVAHELGHEFGADHPFNNNMDGSCGDNAVAQYAYEPGSGSTIMAYAGICSPDDLQRHSDDYFHAVNLTQIQRYLTTTGNTCGSLTPTNNKLVSLPSFATSYNIPYQTPFELTAPTATDSVADSTVLYCWEEWDLGDFGAELVNTYEHGPIFRSYRPSKSPTRVFPKDTMVLAGILSNAGKENNQGEKAPDTARTLTFKLTLRDIYNGNGCFLIPDDEIVLHAINTGAGFTVTSQNDSNAIYIGGTLQTITWNVVGTDKGVVNTPNVEIYMSADGGYTWPDHIGTFPNTGSASVPLPNPDTTVTNARIKVKGSGNVFFNVNKYNFGLMHGDGTDTLINLYPVPTHSTLRISVGNKGRQHFVIYDAVGRKMYAALVDGIYDVPVNLWPRGVYLIKLIDDNNHRTVKKFVVD